MKLTCSGESMTKILLLPLMLFIFSCHSEKGTPIESLGKVRKYEPLAVTLEDSERIRAICNALAAKEDLLSVLVSTGEEYVFNYYQKGCSEPSAPAPKNLVTTIQREVSGYIFQSKNGESFGFPEVETNTQGIFSEICQNTERLMSPILTNTGAMWFTSFTSNEHCQSDAEGICIHFQKGSFVQDFDYIVHTNEWIKIKTMNSRRGFFLERKLISSANCSGKNEFHKEARLK
jgi:hypothetical protein